jgi:hypothetical protein
VLGRRREVEVLELSKRARDKKLKRERVVEIREERGVGWGVGKE